MDLREATGQQRSTLGRHVAAQREKHLRPGALCGDWHCCWWSIGGRAVLSAELLLPASTRNRPALEWRDGISWRIDRSIPCNLVLCPGNQSLVLDYCRHKCCGGADRLFFWYALPISANPSFGDGQLTCLGQ